MLREKEDKSDNGAAAPKSAPVESWIRRPLPGAIGVWDYAQIVRIDHEATGNTTWISHKGQLQALADEGLAEWSIALAPPADGALNGGHDAPADEFATIAAVLDAKASALEVAAGRADTLLERACLEARAAGVRDAVSVVERAALGRKQERSIRWRWPGTRPPHEKT